MPFGAIILPFIWPPTRRSTIFSVPALTPLWHCSCFYVHQEIQLSQASKKEIRQLILSTIKEHLQPGHEAPSPVDLLVGRPRVKRVKHGRRRCNPGHRTKDGQVNNSAGGEGFCEQRAKHYPNGSRSPQLPQENPCCHDDATIIRQRVELQAPQLEVSLDGRWLPSLPSFSPLSSGLSQQHQGLSPPWDTSCKDATSATFLETHLSIDGDKGRFRPSTVAQVASAINSKAIPTTGSGPCAVRDGECRDTVHVQKPSTTSTSQLCKRLGDETEGGHRGSTRSSGESATRHHCHGQGKGWCEGSSEAAAISQHAAIMLERSRALVARAKVCDVFVRHTAIVPQFVVILDVEMQNFRNPLPVLCVQRLSYKVPSR